MTRWSSFLPPDRALGRALSAPGSLSARLAAQWPGFRVERLMQGHRPALPGEARPLQQRHARRVVVREVVLHAADRPLVFAHSVTRAAALRGAWFAVRGLANRPLADLLYADPGVRRLPLAFRMLRRGDPLARRVQRAVPSAPFPLWARRSVFVRGGARLLVTEVFLPAALGSAAHV